ncbi:hypothetical protein F4861DRAFT_366315 [Xylaria intraflava]|nr:hypothetical protein F4861DRAFT_366315 [Xylaria intraflava]
MLRRPPTTLSLTAEDIAAYEDKRYAQLQAQAQAQAQAKLRARSQAARPQLRRHALPQPRPQIQVSAMDTSTSDEAMEDVTPAPSVDEDEDEDVDDEAEEAEDDEEEDEEEEDDDDDHPFSTQRHLRRAAAMGGDRAVSPGAQRGAYVRQLRARSGHARSQSHTSGPTSIPSSISAAASRTQRVTGSASASALPPPTASGLMPQVPAHLQQTPPQNTAPTGTMTTRASAARGGRQISEPPPAPARITRSRDERIGLAGGARPVDTGAGGPGGLTTRRR